jgi:hypothetical protein
MARRPAGQDSEGLFAPGTVTVPLRSRRKASSFWIILLLVSGRTDHGPIRVQAQCEGRLGRRGCCARNRQSRANPLPGADDPIGCDALNTPVRIRHSAVRILSAQPATAVSRGCVRGQRERAIFPEVSGRESGLWLAILGVSNRMPRIWPPVSGRPFFNIRISREGVSRDRLCFGGDGFGREHRTTGPVWPRRVASGLPSRSHSRAVLSSEALGCCRCRGRTTRSVGADWAASTR